MKKMQNFDVIRTIQQTRNTDAISETVGKIENVDMGRKFGFGVRFSSVAKALSAYESIEDFSKPATDFLNAYADNSVTELFEETLPLIKLAPEEYFPRLSDGTVARCAYATRADFGIDKERDKLVTMVNVLNKSIEDASVIDAQTANGTDFEEEYKLLKSAIEDLDLALYCQIAKKIKNAYTPHGIELLQEKKSELCEKLDAIQSKRFYILAEYIRVSKDGKSQKLSGYEIWDSKRNVHFNLKTEKAGSMAIVPSAFTCNIISRLMLEPTHTTYMHKTSNHYDYLLAISKRKSTATTMN